MAPSFDTLSEQDLHEEEEEEIDFSGECKIYRGLCAPLSNTLVHRSQGAI